MHPYLCSPFASRLLRTRTLRARTLRAFCFSLSALLLMLSLLAPALPVQASAAPAAAADPTGPTSPQAPVFVPNGGQTDPRVRFESYALGGTVFFTPQEVVLALPDEPVTQAKSSSLNPAASTAPEAQERVSRSMQVARVKFEGANSSAVISAEDEVPGVLNVMLGSDPSKWQLGLKNYGSIVYKDLYNGINLRYEGQANALKGTYEVAAGADPSQIRWSYKGAADVQVDPTSGDLKVSLVGGKGQLVEHAPQAWQEIGGKRVPVSASYAVSGSKGSTTVGFTLGSYDKTLPLTIDPTLEYSTYLGGAGADRINAMSLNATGDVFVTGETYTVDFPGKTPDELATNSYPNVFVAGMKADGTKIYRTVFGGDNTDQSTGLVVNGALVYLSGYTLSSDFPLKNQFAESVDRHGNTDMFVTLLDGSGAISFSSQMGGPGPDQATALALQGSTLYVTGYTDMYIDSTKCPSDADCSPHAGSDIVLAKVDLSGTSPVLAFIKQFGGGYDDQARAIAVDFAGSVYITGSTTSNGMKSALFPLVSAYQTAFGGGGDAFLTKMDSNGTMVYSSFLGGANTDEGRSILFDAANNTVYITGRTLSSPTTYFPLTGTKSSAWDAFVLKIPTNTSIWAPTGVYLGGNGQDQGNAIALASDGTIYVTGTTSSTDFPLINPLSKVTGGLNDAFLIRYTSAFDKVYSTKLGGSGDDYGQALALYQPGADPTSMVMYLAGYTNSGDFPFPTTAIPGTTSQTKIGGGDDGFIARIGNSRPVVDLNGAGADIDNTASFVETGGAVGSGSGPVSLGASATVTDTDNNTLAYLEARFVASPASSGTAIQPPDRAAESLSVTLAGGMTGSYNATSGVLRLTAGTGTTIADFQSALQSLTYNNTSDTPTTTDRLVAVEASDGMNTNEPLAYVTIGVTASNDKPVLTAPATISGLEDQAKVLNGFTVSDPDAGTNPVKLTFSVPAGVLNTTLSDANKVSGNGTSTLVLTAPMAELNTLLGVGSSAVTYTGAPNYNGNVTLTVTLDDQGYSPSGPLDVSATVTLTLGAVNDPPTFAPGLTSITVNEQDPYSAQSWASNMIAGPADEVASQGLQFVISNISNASLFAAGGSPSIDASGKMSFALETNANGSTTFDVQLVDDGGTADGGIDTSAATQVTLTVNPVNDAPVTTIAMPTLTVIEDTPRKVYLTTDLGFNDDADINPPAYNPIPYNFLSLSSVTITPPTNGTISGADTAKDTGFFTYTPGTNAVASDSFSVQICDSGKPGSLCSVVQTVNINITPVNDKPGITLPTESQSLSVAEDSTTYDTGAAWVTPLTVFDAGPTDEDNTQTVDSFVVSNITNGSLFTTAPTIDVNGNLKFVLAANANGSTQFDVQVVDSGGTDLGGINTSAPVTVTLTVDPINDTPVVPIDAPTITTGEGVAKTVNITTDLGVTDAKDTSSPADVMNAVAFQPVKSLALVINANTPAPTKGSVSFDVNGPSLTYTPAANQSGSDAFTYEVCDLGTDKDASVSLCAMQTVNVTITGINDPPTFTAGAADITVDEDSNSTGSPVNTYNAPWATNISAGPNEVQTLSFEVGISKQYEALFTTLPKVDPISGNLSFVLAPNANTNGISIPLYIQLKDDGSNVPPNRNYSYLIATINLTINPLNDLPVMTDTAITVTEDQAKTFNITSLGVTDDKDTAFGGAALLPLKTAPTFTANPQHGTVTFLTTTVGIDTVYTGEFTYTPAVADYNEGDSFTYQICDNGKPGSACNSQKVTVNFTPVNDPPSFTAGVTDISVNEDGNSSGKPANTYDITWADPTTFDKGALNESSQTLSFEVGMSKQYEVLFTTQPAVDATTGNLKFVLAPNANTNGASIPLNIQLKDDGSNISPNQNYSNLVATINLTINAVNDPPTFSPITPPGTVTVNENSGVYDQPWANPASFSVGPANESTQTLLGFSITANDNAGLFMPGYAPAVTSDGRLQFMPMTGVFGAAHLTVTLKDNGGIALSGKDSYDFPLTINVTSINDLSLSVTPDASGTILPGFGTTFTLTATNPEVTPADNLVFTTTLPALLFFDSATSPDCTAAGQVVTCTVTSVAAGNSASVTLGVLVSSGLGANQAIPFTVNLSALQYDPDMSNNQAGEVVNAVLKKAFYFNDFEANAGSEWSVQTRSQTPLQKRSFLGEFNNQSITLNFDTVEDHGQVEVDFDLFIIRSWDGNQTLNQTSTNSLVPDIAQTDQVRGPDLWEFLADGTNLVHSTFTNWDPMRQSYPARYLADYPCGTDATERKTLGYSYGYFQNLDSVYHIHKVFNHTDSTLTLTFQDLGLQGMLPEGYYDESWGLDNVQVQLLGKPLPYTVYMPMVTKR